VDVRKEEEVGRSSVVGFVAPATSRPSHVDRLIDDLQAVDPIRRDAAVARLRVLGVRALPRLASYIASSASTARARAISALEGTQDPRAAEIALAALGTTDVETAIAALGVLRGWVTQETGTRLLEAITAIAVDRDRNARVRFAAIDALSELPEHLVRPIREQAPPPESAGPALDDPLAAREWVAAHGHAATLSALHDVVKAFREREASAPSSRGRDEWQRARGAAHKALAERGSRVALYDLKETFSATRVALPPGFLEAITTLGDATCLEGLARAWASTRGAAWRGQLVEAAQHIRRRSKLSGRSAVVKDIRARWEGFL
jgi:hypothetical protein